MKKLLFSILMIVFLIIGCGSEPANLLIMNCSPHTMVGIAYFTEYDDNGDPTDYIILKEMELKGEGVIDEKVKPGRYIITYYDLEDNVLTYDDITLEPGENKRLSYGCD